MTSNRYTVCVNSKDEALRVQRQISECVVMQGCATLADLKFTIGEYPNDGDTELGWIDIPVAEISEPENGIVDMDFPMPIPLGLEPEAKETVDHPAHYQSETGLEAWDVIEAFTFDLKGIEAFDTGNVLKYMCRWKSKNGLEDLKKAARYLDHLIDHVEKLEKEND